MKTLLSFCIIFLISVSFLFTDGYTQSTTEFPMGGYEQVPPVRTSALGKMTFTVDGDSLFVSGEFSDLVGQYRSANIHFGKRGDTGPRIFRLSANPEDDHKRGVIRSDRNRFELSEAIKDALREGRMYVVIGSSRHQMGEVRGQVPPMDIPES